MTLTHEQQHILTIVERTASVLSILGICTIIITFSLSRRFRNPMHRIMLINAAYNIFDVTATMISLSGPEAGSSSALCQFQGFLMQMFPLADVLWTLAMACDVFLIVFYKFDSVDLRRLEVRYVGVITTLCFVPAMTFLFIHTPERGHVYGSVSLWCSIAPRWVLLRIIFFYGPIWLVIFTILILYALVGVEILKQRRMFNKINSNYVTPDTLTRGEDKDSAAAIAAIEATLPPRSPLPPFHSIPRSRDEATSGSSSLAKSSETQTQEPCRPIAQSPVSFRQFVFLPLMFFVVLLAVWVAPTVNRVKALIEPGFFSFPLYLAVGSMGSLMGFWNGVVFISIGMKERKRRKRAVVV